MVVVQYFDRSHGMPNAGVVAVSRQLLNPIFAEAGLNSRNEQLWN
jgi:hypothetical protein